MVLGDTRSSFNDPLVSIVLPTYQRPHFLERAVASVLGQTFRKWELLIIDDNGIDSSFQHETEATAQRYAVDPRIRYIRHRENRGGSAARNTGIRAAAGVFVAFLDDDDEWLAEKLELQVERFQQLGDQIALVYTGFRVLDGSGHLMSEVMPKHSGNLYPTILVDNLIGTTSTILCRKDPLLEVGLFDESLPASQDRDLYIRLCQRYEVAYVADPLVLFHQHGAERITGEKTGKVRALDLLHEKYFAAFKKRPRLHSRFLQAQGKLLIVQGDTIQAKEKLASSWLIYPFNASAFVLLIFASLGKPVYDAVRNLTKPFRSFIQRLRLPYRGR